MSTTLHLQLLGGFDLTYGDEPAATIGTPRLQSLLAYLALHRGAPQPRQQLAFLLWPDSSEGQARTNLRNLIHQLRHALPQADEYLCATVHTLQWRADAPFTLDVAEFENALAQGALQQAVDLYHGDLLPGCYDDWIAPERERLQQQYVSALERLIQQLEDERNHRAAIESAQRLLRHDPLREETYRLLMRLCALNGERTGVVRAYDTCVTVLRRELGLEPNVETREAYERCIKLPAMARQGAEPRSSMRAGTRSNNLPHLLTRFIGRGREMSEVKQLLVAHRLVTLTGAGGVGKTRLALAVAEDLVEAFADGVWQVDLAPLSDSSLVAQAAASVLGIQEEGKRPILALLMDYLREKHLLMILDNCEHLVEAVRSLTEALLHAAPNLKVLATSRVVLGIAGEVTWRVPSLSMPDVSRQTTAARPGIEDTPQDQNPALVLGQYESVQVFADRAAAVLPTFALTNQNVGAVGKICQQLDGIPLALELAAARVKLLTAQQIADRLDDALRLLTQGNPTALPRHQTLRTTMDWSHALLTREEQLLFRRLSVFVGGATFEAIEAICSGEGIERGQTLDLLSGLVDKSLVAVDQSGAEARFHLHEVARQYAREKLLEADEKVRACNQHLGFFLNLAEQAELELVGPNQLAWLERLDCELGNLRAALQWSLKSDVETGLRLASALGLFWRNSGHISDGYEWLSQLLGQPEAASLGLVRAKALNVQNDFLIFRDNLDLAYKSAKESLALYRELGNKQGEATSLLKLGTVCINQGNTSQARSLLNESLALYRSLNDRLGISEALCELSGRVGYEASRRYLVESLTICRQLGHLAGIANRLRLLGEMATSQGDYASARRWLNESLDIRHQFEKTRAAYALHALGEVAQRQGDYEQAHAYYEETLRLYKEAGHYAGIPVAIADLGHVALQQGDERQARSLFEESLRLFKEAGNVVRIACTLEELASLAVKQGLPERGARLLGLVEVLLKTIGFTHRAARQMDIDRDLAVIHEQLGEATFASAWAKGQAMTLDEAIAYALEKADG